MATNINVVDHPGQRKVHTTVIPKLGGIAILAGILGSLILAQLFYRDVFSTRLLIILGGAIATTVLGVLDDIYTLQAPVKLLGQCLVAGLVVLLGVEVTQVTIPLTGQTYFLGQFSKLFAFIWILIVMNIMNLIDGLDGLAAGIAVISGLSLFVISILLGQLNSAYLLMGMAGAAIGFLRYNYHPASIFMGDTGSLLLGYILAVASIEGVLKSSVMISLALPVLSLLIPLADTGLAIMRRTKRNVHIFKADAEHIHHKLIAAGFSHSQTVLIMYYASLILNLLAIALTFLSGAGAVLMVILMGFVLYRASKLIKGYLYGKS
jgi:UDP-GlcNAc:undecaprenyl-phosphate GlcNAc-1-phosphate transferase